MKKLSFFSVPRNKTRKETIEVIKNALIANGWKFVEKSERSKNKSWVRIEVMQKKNSFATHFLRPPPVIYRDTEVSSARGGQLFPLVCFRDTHKGFQRVSSSIKKGNNSAISCIHSCLFIICSICNWGNTNLKKKLFS